MKKINSYDLLRTLNEVDEEIILEAAPSEKKAASKLPWKRISAAACLAVFVLLGVLIWRIGTFGGGTQTASLDDGTPVFFEKSDAPERSSSDLAVTSRQLTGEEIKMLFGDLPVTACALFSQENQALVGIEGKLGAVKLMISATDRPISDTVVVGSGQISKINGVAVSACYYITRANSHGKRSVVYYAGFELDGSAVYVEITGSKSESEALRNELTLTVQKLIENGKPDWSKISE